MQLQCCLKHLDQDGRKTFREVKKEVTRRVHQYYDLIVNQTREW
jgi:hypothetical protein